MATIYGPFGYYFQNDLIGYTRKTKYKVRGLPRPPTPYFVDEVLAAGYWNQNTGSVVNTHVLLNSISSLQTKAYDKFWNVAHSRANVGISLFESKKSFQMIALRCGQMYRSLRHLDAGNFRKAWVALSTSSPQPRLSSRVRSRPRENVANAWLEYTFGWVPLIQDVFSAVDVLQQDFDTFRTSTKVTMPWYLSLSSSSNRYSLNYSSSYFYKAKTRVNNPNLLLANQLGVLNPAHIAWDAIPFSFVADWFLPVGKFIQSWTNGAGLAVIDPVHGCGCIGNGVGWHISYGSTSFRNKIGNRITGALPTPGPLSRVRFPNVDPWLSMTSLSLLTQQLARINNR